MIVYIELMKENKINQVAGVEVNRFTKIPSEELNNPNLYSL
jgi:hypothetical protein